MFDIAEIEDMTADCEPLESFELDDYADQEDISFALKLFNRELY